MRVFYYSSIANFGDEINAWLWNELLADLMNDDDNIRFVGIGTLLKDELIELKGLKVIFGAGAGYGKVATVDKWRSCEFRFVRGPMTASLYDHPSVRSITDPALLIRITREFENQSNEKGGKVLFIPHWTSALYGEWRLVCSRCGVQYVDPFDDCRKIIREVSRAKLVVAEAMHGAIIADAMRVPWIPVRSSEKICCFKWWDWCASMELEYHPVSLPPSDLFDCLYQGRRQVSILNTTEFTKEGGRSDNGIGGTSSFISRRIRGFKPQLRKLRRFGIDFVKRFKSARYVGRFNEGYLDFAAESLLRSLGTSPYLSDGAVHDRRLDQLVGELHDLRNNYPSLVGLARTA